MQLRYCLLAELVAAPGPTRPDLNRAPTRKDQSVAVIAIAISLSASRRKVVRHVASLPSSRYGARLHSNGRWR
jgi:hypothetical protein